MIPAKKTETFEDCSRSSAREFFSSMLRNDGGRLRGAFSGKVDTGFPQKMRLTKELERVSDFNPVETRSVPVAPVCLLLALPPVWVVGPWPPAWTALHFRGNRRILQQWRR
jgi:hypothetical protein